MATIKLPATGDSGNATASHKLDAISTLVQHDGRVFIGEKMEDRKEVDLRTAIAAVLGNGAPNHPNGRTIYLTPKPKPTYKSRADRWTEAAGEAMAALTDLKGVQEEYQEWQENLGDKFEGSATKEKLQEVVDLDIESAISIAEEAEGMELPVGFGRD